MDRWRAAPENALAATIEARPPRLVVDLSGLAFCDSTGLNALLKTRLAAQAARRRARDRRTTRPRRKAAEDHEYRPPGYHLRQHPHRRLRPADGPSPRAGRRATMSSELKTSTRRIGRAVVCVLAATFTRAPPTRHSTSSTRHSPNSRTSSRST
ncbi:STAS domain-containing protein [Kitasatospora arboriphila]